MRAAGTAVPGDPARAAGAGPTLRSTAARDTTRPGDVPVLTAPPLPRTTIRRAVWPITAAALVAATVLMVAFGDAGDVLSALAGADIDLVVLATLLYVLGQSLSGVMWGVCQRAGGVHGMSWGHLMGVHWMSRAACEALPASLGEAVRVALVRRHPAGAAAGTWRIAGALAANKVVDGIVTGAVVLAILLAAPLPPQVAGLRTTALVSVAVGAALVLVARRRGGLGALRLPARLRRALGGLSEGAAVMRRPADARRAALVGIAAIAARIASLAVLLAAFSAPPEAALLVYAVVVLSGLLPLTPGGAGQREAMLVPALAAAHGVSASTGLAVSLSVQATALIASLTLGGLALLVHRRRLPVAAPVEAEAAIAPAAP